MIPAGLVAFEGSLWLWIFAAIRPGAAFLVAPVFGAPAVPLQLRLVIALALGLPGLASGAIALPADGIASLSGGLAIMAEVVTGLALGLAAQIGFAAALTAGEIISNAMGLGFAVMADPLAGSSNPAIGQFLSIVALLIFLASGGHLVFAGLLVESYHLLPPGKGWLASDVMVQLANFGGLILATGFVIALPVSFALVLVQLAMGVLTRSAPTLNLFAVGMPAAALAGIVLLAIALPAMVQPLTAALAEGLAIGRQLLRP